MWVLVETGSSGYRNLMIFKFGDCAKMYKNLWYTDQKVQKFVETKNENFLSALSDKFHTIWHCTRSLYIFFI
jgi:hypothetical protein